MRRLERYSGGAMLIVAGVAFELVLVLTPAARMHDGKAASDLERVVQAIEVRYHLQAKAAPMMGIATLFAKAATERRRFDHVGQRRCS